jgi:hypothetical protein
MVVMVKVAKNGRLLEIKETSDKYRYMPFTNEQKRKISFKRV